MRPQTLQFGNNLQNRLIAAQQPNQIPSLAASMAANPTNGGAAGIAGVSNTTGVSDDMAAKFNMLSAISLNPTGSIDINRISNTSSPINMITTPISQLSGSCAGSPRSHSDLVIEQQQQQMLENSMKIQSLTNAIINSNPGSPIAASPTPNGVGL